ncbi:helix-turn-helix domain-containing protein [Actinomadura livida]|uniref:Helix-turn-helix transcriptional regulator n=2 Tax=Actinomadura livida TaxID=79909 RepID=A0ABP3QXL5_9ACTN|nr:MULTISPECIES: helix-turn-helix transcriptional regulator [Actinomadura]GGU39737.1 transcriptional regulator [Actinomadura livida]
MSARDSLDPAGSLWDLIAVQLRRHREERKMSGSKLADFLDLDRSSVSRLESGGMKLQVKHARLLDREWQTGGLFAFLVGFAIAGHDTEWFKAHAEMELRASELRIWELSWIPGLFQSEDYARAMFEAAGLHDIDAHLALRMKRQEVLNRDPGPVMRVFLDQGVIEQPVGAPEIMRAQLATLLERAQHPNITFRIVPRCVGAHMGRDGSFKIMTVAHSEVAYTEACGGGRLVMDGTEVRSFRLRFDRISDRALPVDASIELIKRIMEGLQ